MLKLNENKPNQCTLSHCAIRHSAAGSLTLPKPLCTFSRVNRVKTPNIQYFPLPQRNRLWPPPQLSITKSHRCYLLCVTPCLEPRCILKKELRDWTWGVNGRDQRWPSYSWPENLGQQCGHGEAKRRALGWHRAEKTKRETQTGRQRSRSMSGWHSASILCMSMIHQWRSFCCFSDCTQALHFGLFCWLGGLLHFF